MERDAQKTDRAKLVVSRQTVKNNGEAKRHRQYPRGANDWNQQGQNNQEQSHEGVGGCMNERRDESHAVSCSLRSRSRNLEVWQLFLMRWQKLQTYDLPGLADQLERRSRKS